MNPYPDSHDGQCELEKWVCIRVVSQKPKDIFPRETAWRTRGNWTRGQMPNGDKAQHS